MNTETAEPLTLEMVESKPAAAMPLANVAPQSPMAMMMQATANGMSPDTLERMWALQVKFLEQEAEKKHNEAFAGFKAEAVRVIKNRTVDDGPLKGKKYAELFAVNNAATGPLAKHGLSTYWRTTKDEPEWIEVTCYLKHVGGHVESVSLGGPPDKGGAKSPMQARASTVSYLERYTLKMILGLAEQGEDDDANPHAKTADADSEAFATRDQWIANLNAAINEPTLQRTWKMAVDALHPLNRMDVYGSVRDAMQAKLTALRGGQS